jgi:DUF2934 family protein
MTKMKTELATLRQHDDAVRNAIERKTCTFYEFDDFKDGNDQEHWFRAERELTTQDIPFAIEEVGLSLRLALEEFPGFRCEVWGGSISRVENDADQRAQCI